jgi:hypothetical protein
MIMNPEMVNMVNSRDSRMPCYRFGSSCWIGVWYQLLVFLCGFVWIAITLAFVCTVPGRVERITPGTVSFFLLKSRLCVSFRAVPPRILSVDRYGLSQKLLNYKAYTWDYPNKWCHSLSLHEWQN